MVGTAELVALAIQAGVRLARAGRRIYLENTAAREIAISLPASFTSPIGEARSWAAQLELTGDPRFAEVYQAAYEADASADTPEQQRLASLELVQIYLLDVSRGLVPTLAGHAGELAGLAALSQWGKDESPLPHPLQRVAGALVETAIDHFLHTPGALNAESRRGRAVRSLLEGLDDFDYQESRWDSILIALFSAGLETLCDHPELVTGDADRQRLLGGLMKRVAGDVQRRLQALAPAGDLDAEDRIRDVATTLLRSTLRNGGVLLAENPAVMGIEKGAERAFFEQTFSSFMDLLVPDPAAGGPLDVGAALRRVASSRGMDRLVSAALLAGSEYPEAFGVENGAAARWLQYVLRSLYENHAGGRSFFDVDLFAEIAALVIRNGSADLPRLLGTDAHAQATAVLVARELYALLAHTEGVDAPRWRMTLARSEVLGVFEDVLHAIAASPAWAIEMGGDRARLAELVRAGVQTLMDLGEGSFKQLLRGDHLEPLLAAALRTGLAERLSGRDRERVAKRVRDAAALVRSHGISGLEFALASGAVQDLLAALVESGSVEVLVGDDDARIRATLDRTVAILDVSRKGETLSVPEMIDELKEVA
jgi:hypothetical protein